MPSKYKVPTVTLTCRHRLLCALAFALCSVANAQDLAPDAPPVAVSPFICNPWKIQVFPDSLSLGQRACLEYSELAGPALVAESALMAGYSQWRNNPHMRRTDSDDIAVRFEHLYERRTARITAETIVGYLHHEDPRLRPSGKQGVWNRTGAALLSVLESPDQDGKERMAFAPLAGSLGSGLTSIALYQRQTSIGFALERSGVIYSHYFIRALYHEFSPDIWSLAPHFLRKYHSKDITVD